MNLTETLNRITHTYMVREMQKLWARKNFKPNYEPRRHWPEATQQEWARLQRTYITRQIIPMELSESLDLY